MIEVTQLAYNGRTYELHSSQYSQQGASRNTYAAAAITGGAGVGDKSIEHIQARVVALGDDDGLLGGETRAYGS